MKKISDTFLEFAEPLLELVDSPSPVSREYKKALDLAHLIWNAVVYSEMKHSIDFLGDIRKQIQDEDVAPFIEVLIERKKQLYGKDLRLIGNYEIRKKADGSYSLWAEARGDNIQ